MVADCGRQLVQLDGEVGELHLAGQHVMQRAAAAFRAIDRGGVPFDKGRTEERKALDVIPVRMSKENVRVNGFVALGHQRGGQPVRARAAVKNQKVTVGGGQLNAGGIAAEVVGTRPRGGNRSPRSPETYSHGPAANPGWSWRMCSCLIESDGNRGAGSYITPITDGPSEIGRPQSTR